MKVKRNKRRKMMDRMAHGTLNAMFLAIAAANIDERTPVRTKYTLLFRVPIPLLPLGPPLAIVSVFLNHIARHIKGSAKLHIVPLTCSSLVHLGPITTPPTTHHPRPVAARNMMERVISIPLRLLTALTLLPPMWNAGRAR